MLTYISLAIGMISALVGTFVKPFEETSDGSRKLKKASILFIVLPLLAFGFASVETYKSNSENSSLKDTIEKSIDRVDAFEVRVTYAFRLSEIGIDPSVKQLMRDLLPFYAVISQDKAGSQIYGIARNMFGPGQGTDDEKLMLASIEASLRQRSNVFPVELLISSGAAATEDSFIKDVREAIRMGIATPQLEARKIKGSFAHYLLRNPISFGAFPPPEIAESEYHWRIPNKDADDPEIQWTWRYRVFSSPNAQLRILHDFKDATYVIFAPKLNPDFDSSPALSAYESPFGRIIHAQVLVGGLNVSWSDPENLDEAADLIAAPRQSQPARVVGQVFELRE